MKITAIVPVKGTSKRLPNKNKLPFGNGNLLTHKLNQLRKCKLVNDILVSSDSQELLDIAKLNGAKINLRPSKYTLDETPFGDFVEYISNKIDADYILWACVTSPLIDNNDYDTSISHFLKNKYKYDSIVSLYPFKHYLFDSKGPLNFKPGIKHSYSQYLPEMYLYTNGINFAKKKDMLEWKFNFGPNPYRYIVSQSKAIDIDTYEDYLVAKTYFEDLI